MIPSPTSAHPSEPGYPRHSFEIRGRTVSALASPSSTRVPASQQQQQQTQSPSRMKASLSKRLSLMSYLPSSSNSKDRALQESLTSPVDSSPIASSPSSRLTPSSSSHAHSNSLSSFLSPTSRISPTSPQTQPSSQPLILSQPSFTSARHNTDPTFGGKSTQQQQQQHAQSFVPTMKDPAALNRSRTLARQMLGPAAQPRTLPTQQSQRYQQQAPQVQSSQHHQHHQQDQQHRLQSPQERPNEPSPHASPRQPHLGDRVPRPNDNTAVGYRAISTFPQHLDPLDIGAGQDDSGIMRSRSVSTPIFLSASLHSNTQPHGRRIDASRDRDAILKEGRYEHYHSHEGPRGERVVLIDGRLFGFNEQGTSLHLVSETSGT